MSEVEPSWGLLQAIQAESEQEMAPWSIINRRTGIARAEVVVIPHRAVHDNGALHIVPVLCQN